MPPPVVLISTPTILDRPRPPSEPQTAPGDLAEPGSELRHPDQEPRENYIRLIAFSPVTAKDAVEHRQRAVSRLLTSHITLSSGNWLESYHASTSSTRTPYYSEPPYSRCSNGVETFPPYLSSITGVYRQPRSNSCTRLHFPQQRVQRAVPRLESSRPEAEYRETTGHLATGEGKSDTSSVITHCVTRIRQSEVRRQEAMPAYDTHFAQDTNGDNAETSNSDESAHNVEKTGDETIVAHRRIKSGPGRQEDIMQSGNEDLFLNLAQDANPRPPLSRTTSRSERRPVDTTKYRQSLPPYASHEQNHALPHDLPLQSSERSSRRSESRSDRFDRPRTSDGGRHVNNSGRLFGLSSRNNSYSNSQINDTSPEVPKHGRRRPSITNSVQSSNQRHPQHRSSRLAYSNANDLHTRLPYASPTDISQADIRPSLPDGTDSVNSNTAPSTVWDELDELKSRIKKLELTGKLPATSGQAISSGSGERPRTATTTVTTISSSPKHRKTATPPTAATPDKDSRTANMYPFLHSALARAKGVLSSSTYRTLEATASDAIALATMTGSIGPQSNTFGAASLVNGATTPDRQLRRKADNMCRNLTDLCIALCDAHSVASPKSPASTMRPSSRGTLTGKSTIAMEPRSPSNRQTSLEPERDIPSRALSRVQARRTSLNPPNTSTATSPKEVTTPRTTAFNTLNTPPSSQPSSGTLPSRFTRTATSLLRARRRGGETHESTSPDSVSLLDEPTLRAPSRAMTEIGQGGQSNLQRFRNRVGSREYTSSHPLPSHQQHLQQSPTVVMTDSPANSPLQHALAGRRAAEVGVAKDAAAGKLGGTGELPLRGSGRRYQDANVAASSPGTTANLSPANPTALKLKRLSGGYGSSPLAGGEGKDERRRSLLGRGARGGSMPIE
ncbi:MAG: hypothetical protein M1820_007318 [Bogoriella megaspora]|nr:MAG: hypothetical protein M1820_007318 [Bogoriella megaspora]